MSDIRKSSSQTENEKLLKREEYLRKIKGIKDETWSLWQWIRFFLTVFFVIAGINSTGIYLWNIYEKQESEKRQERIINLKKEKEDKISKAIESSCSEAGRTARAKILLKQIKKNEQERIKTMIESDGLTYKGRNYPSITELTTSKERCVQRVKLLQGGPDLFDLLYEVSNSSN